MIRPLITSLLLVLSTNTYAEDAPPMSPRRPVAPDSRELGKNILITSCHGRPGDPTIEINETNLELGGTIVYAIIVDRKPYFALMSASDLYKTEVTFFMTSGAPTQEAVKSSSQSDPDAKLIYTPHRNAVKFFYTNGGEPHFLKCKPLQ